MVGDGPLQSERGVAGKDWQQIARSAIRADRKSRFNHKNTDTEKHISLPVAINGSGDIR
jgi:hypothetical protein